MEALIQNRCRRRREGEGRPICLESIWAKRVPNKQIRLSLITISQVGGEQRNSMNMLSPGIGGMGV